MLNLPKRPTPTRAQLDATNPHRRALITLGVLGVIIAIAAIWWAKNGTRLVEEVLFELETLSIYWKLVATPEERAVWTWLLIGLVLSSILGLVLFHRFVWRAFFPDLVRLDPNAHPGGRPERIGRLYRTHKFFDDGTTRYRHYYKHGHRWLPLFRFDFVDLDEPAKRTVHGVVRIHCGRLDRDPEGNTFRRIPATDRYGSAPLSTHFRSREVLEDHDRKSSIVMPGPGMNPEAMRRKWQTGQIMTRWEDERDEEEYEAELEEAFRRAGLP